MTRTPDEVDRDLETLLQNASPPAAPDPAFAVRLESAFIAQAGRRRVRIFRCFILAVGAFLATAAILAADSFKALLDRDSATPRAEVLDRADFGLPAARSDGPAGRTVRYASDRGFAIWVDKPGVGLAAIEGVAELRMSDLAAARFEPAASDRPARLFVGAGRVDVRAETELVIEAADLAIAAHQGTRVELGVVPLGAGTMRNEILSAAGGVVLGAVAVGFVLRGGDAELTLPGGDAAALERGRAHVIERPSDAEAEAAASRAADELRARETDVRIAREELFRAQNRIRDLESDLAAVRKEAADARQAAADKTGVELSEVLGRLTDLKKKGLASLIDPSSTAQVVSDLKALGPAGTKAMIDMLDDADKESRFLAARILESLGDPAAVPALLATALKEGESEMVVSQASHAIALMDHPSVVEPCREIYEKASNEGARVNALFGWARHGDPKGLTEAARFIADEKNSEMMRDAIGQGFLFLADDRAMSVADAYVDARRSNGQVAMLAVSYYERIGSPAARARLRALADDPKVPQGARDAANKALLND